MKQDADLCLVKLWTVLIGFRKTWLFSISVLSTEGKGSKLGLLPEFQLLTWQIQRTWPLVGKPCDASSLYEFMMTPFHQWDSGSKICPSSQNPYPEIWLSPIWEHHQPKFIISPLHVPSSLSVPILVVDATRSFTSETRVPSCLLSSPASLIL